MKGLARVAISVAVLLAASAAAAQSYPARPVRMLVPYPAGGTTDIYARLVANSLSKTLGQPFVVENKPGAATAIVAEIVARAPADGYTMMMATVTTMAINPHIFSKLPYRVEQLQPVALVAKAPFALVAPLNFPPNSLTEAVAYAKANPGKVNYGTNGNGGSSHLVGELLRAVAGIDIVPVHYRGSAPALTDIASGQIQLYFDGISTSLPQIASNRMKALAVTSKARSPAAATLPTVVEQGFPDLVSYSWYGVIAQAGLPADLLKLLNAEINRFVQSKEMNDRILADASEPANLTPVEFAAMIAEESEMWRKVLQPLKLQLD